MDLANTLYLFDSLIHLQDSQTCSQAYSVPFMFDSLIHLQDSQTTTTRLMHG